MIQLRLYDRSRTPSSWTEVVRPGQFVAFAKMLETGASCDSDGKPFAAVEDATCLVFDRLGEAEAFCRDRAHHAPGVRFEIFDSALRSQAPLLVVVHPSKQGQLEGNSRGMTLRKQAAIVLLIVAAVSFWYNFHPGPSFRIFPTLLGINLVVVALRLLQLNGAYANAERLRQQRLAEYERR